ncbi:unnamed protein product, partial [marine sediment metagenome]
MTSLDTAVISLASERITAQVSVQWVEEAAGQLGDSGWVVAAELLIPA